MLESFLSFKIKKRLLGLMSKNCIHTCEYTTWWFEIYMYIEIHIYASWNGYIEVINIHITPHAYLIFCDETVWSLFIKYTISAVFWSHFPWNPVAFDQCFCSVVLTFQIAHMTKTMMYLNCCGRTGLSESQLVIYIWIVLDKFYFSSLRLIFKIKILILSGNNDYCVEEC